MFIVFTILRFYCYRNTDDTSFYNALAGLVIGIIIARIHGEIIAIETEEKIRQMADSKYGYYVELYDRYLESKLKKYEFNYKMQNCDNVFTAKIEAMDKNEAYRIFKAFYNDPIYIETNNNLENMEE